MRRAPEVEGSQRSRRNRKYKPRQRWTTKFDRKTSASTPLYDKIALRSP